MTGTNRRLIVPQLLNSAQLAELKDRVTDPTHFVTGPYTEIVLLGHIEALTALALEALDHLLIARHCTEPWACPAARLVAAGAREVVG